MRIAALPHPHSKEELMEVKIDCRPRVGRWVEQWLQAWVGNAAELRLEAGRGCNPVL